MRFDRADKLQPTTDDVSKAAPTPKVAHLSREREELERLFAKFACNRRPLNVSFRDLVAGSNVGNARHGIHAYPARLLPHIPHFLLRTSLISPEATVADPFCGSGTVLLEATLAGCKVAGADANPLARLITRVKLREFDPARLAAARGRLLQRIATRRPKVRIPDVVNLDYWFSRRIQRELHKILGAIERTRDCASREFFLLAFSSTVRDVSFADPRLSVPVRLREDQYDKKHWLFSKTQDRLRRLKNIKVLPAFLERLDSNIARVRDEEGAFSRGLFRGISEDARSLGNLPNDTVDLIITSPPYIGAQKYIRASSLSLTWLRLCGASGLRQLEDHNIGREHFSTRDYEALIPTGLKSADRTLTHLHRINPLRAHIAAKYLEEMRLAIREMRRILRPGRYAVLVVGAGHVCGKSFDTPRFLTEIAEEEGFVLRAHLIDKIRSRALMTKRHHTAGQIDAESIIFLSKGF